MTAPLSAQSRERTIAKGNILSGRSAVVEDTTSVLSLQAESIDSPAAACKKRHCRPRELKSHVAID